MGNILTTRTRTLRFHSAALPIIRRDGEVWLRLFHIGSALGYKNPSMLVRIYQQHAAEFTDRMTQLVTLPTAGGPQEVRLFSLRGAHLLAMFARTERAAEFRRWVLDVLDAQAGGPAAPAPAALPPPPPALPPPPAAAAPALPAPAPTGPSLKGRRWLVTIDEAGKETVEPIPSGADFGTFTWKRIADMLRFEAQSIPREEIMGLAEAATRAAFGAAANSPKGAGDQIADAIHHAGDELALADLQKIATAAASELWGRVLAHHDGRAGTPGSRVTALVPVGPNAEVRRAQRPARKDEHDRQS